MEQLRDKGNPVGAWLYCEKRALREIRVISTWLDRFFIYLPHTLVVPQKTTTRTELLHFYPNKGEKSPSTRSCIHFKRSSSDYVISEIYNTCTSCESKHIIKNMSSNLLLFNTQDFYVRVNIFQHSSHTFLKTIGPQCLRPWPTSTKRFGQLKKKKTFLELLKKWGLLVYRYRHHEFSIISMNL